MMTDEIYFTFEQLLAKWYADEQKIFSFISSGHLHPSFIVNDINSIKPFLVETRSEIEIETEKEISPLDVEYESLIDNDGLGRHFLVEPKFKTSKLFYFEHSRQKIKKNKNKNVYFKHFKKVEETNVGIVFDLDFIKNHCEFNGHDVKIAEKKDVTLDSDGMKKVINHNNVSDYLAYLNQASSKFWANVPVNEKIDYPSNATVEHWLIDKGFPKTLAEKGATIIRPSWASKGRKPDF
jgi:hypothetical protein